MMKMMLGRCPGRGAGCCWELRRLDGGDRSQRRRGGERRAAENKIAPAHAEVWRVDSRISLTRLVGARDFGAHGLLHRLVSRIAAGTVDLRLGRITTIVQGVPLLRRAVTAFS